MSYDPMQRSAGRKPNYKNVEALYLKNQQTNDAFLCSPNNEMGDRMKEMLDSFRDEIREFEDQNVSPVKHRGTVINPKKAG